MTPFEFLKRTTEMQFENITIFW